MSSEGMSLGVEVVGSRQALARFKQLPKDASAELRKASLELSRELARWIAAAGEVQGGQAAAVAPTVKAKFDRIPAVNIGGSKRVTRTGATASELLFGSEFGHHGQGGAGKGTRDYSPHGFGPRRAGNPGTWVYPTLKVHRDDIGKRWLEAAEAIADKFEGA